jgi:hypothetical protein
VHKAPHLTVKSSDKEQKIYTAASKEAQSVAKITQRMSRTYNIGDGFTCARTP